MIIRHTGGRERRIIQRSLIVNQSDKRIIFKFLDDNAQGIKVGIPDATPENGWHVGPIEHRNPDQRDELGDQFPTLRVLQIAVWAHDWINY